MFKSLQNSSTGSVCTPPDQSIPVKTPRTSTPSLKTIIASCVDKKLDHSNTVTTANKRRFDHFDQRKGTTLTVNTKKNDQQSQNCKKTNQNTNRLCDKANTRDDLDDRKRVTHNKKSVLPLKVTEKNIDSFLNQLNSKPRPVIKKYSTRSSVKQSLVTDGKQQTKQQENVTHKKQPVKPAVKQQSYRSASSVVKLQQNKHNRLNEVPVINLSAFDFNDDDNQPMSKKPRQVDTSTSSSCNSSLEMSRLNASLLARGNTSKSFSMTPQKKGRNPKNKRQSPNKKPVSSQKTKQFTVVKYLCCRCRGKLPVKLTTIVAIKPIIWRSVILYVCMYMCVCACVCACVFVCVYIAHVCVYVYVHVCVYM